MNVTVHHEKEKNEETKTDKIKAGEKRKRKQANNFKEALCCPSGLGQGAASRKMKGSDRGN